MSIPLRKLGEIGDFRNGLNYSKRNFGRGLKVISVKDFGDRWRPDLTILDEIDPAGIRVANSDLRAGDILFVRSNGNKELIGRSMLIEHDLENVSFSGFCIRLRPISCDVNSRFLSMYFRTSLFRRTLSQQGKGTNINNLNQTILERMDVPWPTMVVQDRIVDVAGAYDDLIENNRRRIALLEEAARMLYREWFVHFRFPGHEHVKITDGLPEGWKRQNLGEISSIRKGKNITRSIAEEGEIPVVAGGLQPAYFHSKSNAIGPAITISASGANAGYVALYHTNIWASDCSYLSVVDNPKIWFLYLTIKSRQIEITGMQQGAAQPHVYPKHLERLNIVYPPMHLRNLFDDYVDASFRQIANLKAQMNVLAQARDLLLPRLMNGEIAV